MASSKTVSAILAAVVFLNAFLLFAVEPMFAKLVLPFLGGTPSVWNTCLVFYQAALLVGYLYAHGLCRIRDGRLRLGVHAALLAVSFFALPLSVRVAGNPPIGNAAIPWLFGLIAVSLGAPFVMLASTSPLAQGWLADFGVEDPYFLYAASNLGSFAALVAYPVIVEPDLSLTKQRLAWSVGYAVLAIALLASFALMSRNARNAPAEKPAESHVTGRQRLTWTIYSAVPAALLFAVTTHISTDVAAVPLLWIIPLALYLLTFVLVFARRAVIKHSWMSRAAPHALVVASIPILWNMRLPGVLGIVLDLAVLFIVAMVSHGELAARRPPASRLTEFFIWVAIGGLAGGCFVALVAPVAFNRVYEYPLALAAAAAILPSVQIGRRSNRFDYLLPFSVFVCLVLLAPRVSSLPSLPAILLTILAAVVTFSFRERSIRFALALAAICAAGYVRDSTAHKNRVVLDRERSFFGVYRVVADSTARLVNLYHGTTLHGAQSTDGSRRLVPLTYYHPDGPVGDIFSHTPAGLEHPRSVGIVGLGAGSIACFGRSNEHWTYYEIDPAVIHIALDPRFFTFMRDCPPRLRIVAGDARLTLRREPSASFDILILDAFSSDAIPIHLLTREAFQEYWRLMRPHGVIAVHISNNHLDLEPVMAAVASDQRVNALVRHDFNLPEDDAAHGRSPSVWVILGKSVSDFGPLNDASQWMLLRTKRMRPWTDDFSNIVSVLKR
jgi:SAM-dependent methyltransferase